MNLSGLPKDNTQASLPEAMFLPDVHRPFESVCRNSIQDCRYFDQPGRPQPEQRLSG
jgi:hypothetical protein